MTLNPNPNPNDLRTYLVQKTLCKTCPFAGEKPLPLAADRYSHYLENLLGKWQHLCHSATNKICRGGRDIQLKWLCAKRKRAPWRSELYQNQQINASIELLMKL